MRPYNIYEDVVFLLVDEVIASEGGCTCERCRSDVMAIALNSLKPVYVVSESGKAYMSNRTQLNQAKVDAYRAVLRAVNMVKQNPCHDDGSWTT